MECCLLSPSSHYHLTPLLKATGLIIQHGFPQDRWSWTGNHFKRNYAPVRAAHVNYRCFWWQLMIAKIHYAARTVESSGRHEVRYKHWHWAKGWRASKSPAFGNMLMAKNKVLSRKVLYLTTRTLDSYLTWTKDVCQHFFCVCVVQCG